MVEEPTRERDLGYFLALAQTGLEMVVPIAIGVFLDNHFGWTPWATTVGAILGLTGGLAHMLIMLKRSEDRRPPDSPRGPQ